MAHKGFLYPYVPPALRLLRWDMPQNPSSKGLWYFPARWYVETWERPKFDWPSTFAQYSNPATLENEGTALQWTWGPVDYDGHEFIIYAYTQLYTYDMHLIPFVAGTKDNVYDISAEVSEDYNNYSCFAPSSIDNQWLDSEGFNTGTLYPGFVPGPW